MTDSDEWDATLIPLAVELMTVAMGDDGLDFLRHCAVRLTEDAPTPDKLYRLVAVLATFGGTAVSEWAKDLNVLPEQLMLSISLDIQDP